MLNDNQSFKRDIFMELPSGLAANSIAKFAQSRATKRSNPTRYCVILICLTSLLGVLQPCHVEDHRDRTDFGNCEGNYNNLYLHRIRNWKLFSKQILQPSMIYY